MSHRDFLSRLSLEQLAGLHNQAQEVAELSAADETATIEDLNNNLADAYPGLMKFADALVALAEKDKMHPEYSTGILAGAVLMVQVITLAAEHDEFGQLGLES